MDYKQEYLNLKDGIWNIMEQLRELPKDKKTGSWPDINAYSIWFTLFALATSKRKEKTNEQLNQFSNIYFNKIKKNITINEL